MTGEFSNLNYCLLDDDYVWVFTPPIHFSHHCPVYCEVYSVLSTVAM